MLAALAGGLMYYLLVYAYYTPVPEQDLQAVRLTSIVSGAPEEIAWDQLEAVAGDGSPIRYRACFTTPLSLPMLSETYTAYEAPEPLIGPEWFECFDAKAIGAALQSGEALAFLGEANPRYGVDRVIAVFPDGRGYAWHQLNACGEAVFGGDAPPADCPPAPEQEAQDG